MSYSQNYQQLVHSVIDRLFAERKRCKTDTLFATERGHFYLTKQGLCRVFNYNLTPIQLL